MNNPQLPLVGFRGISVGVGSDMNHPPTTVGGIVSGPAAETGVVDEFPRVKSSRGNGHSRRVRRGLGPAAETGVVDEFGAAFQVQFLHAVGFVGLDGLHADRKFVGDLFVRIAVGDEGQHLDFAFRQRFTLRRRYKLCRPMASGPATLAKHCRYNFRPLRPCESRLSARQSPPA